MTVPPDRSPISSLARRLAIITGAATGIGRELAQQVAGPEWHLVLIDLNAEGLKETAALAEQRGATQQMEILDVADPANWPTLRDRLQSQWPALDLLCNNAGVSGAGEVGQFSLENWHWLLDINLFAPIHACHTFVPWLKQNPRGAHIINTASLAGLIAAPTMGAYSISKAGLIALSQTLYSELRPHGVGVTVVCPGFVKTDLVQKGRFVNEALRTEAQGFINRGQVTAADVAAAALHAMRRKKLFAVLGWKARWLWRVQRLTPGAMCRLISWLRARNAKSADKPQ